MTTFLAIFSLAMAWVVGTGMILLLGWKQDGRVRKIDTFMACCFGLVFWVVLAQEIYRAGADNIRRRIS